MRKTLKSILLIYSILVGTACSNNNELDDTPLEEVAPKEVTDIHEAETFTKTEVQKKAELKAYYDTLEFNIVYAPPYFKQALNIGSDDRHQAEKLANASSLAERIAIYSSQGEGPQTYHYSTNIFSSEKVCSFCDKQSYLKSENPNYQEQRIYHYPSIGSDVTAFEGYVCFDTRDFQGSNIPFEGYTRGGIREITIDGKKIDFDVNSDLFFRQRLDIYIGYNKFPVKIIDNSGRERKDWIVIETERVKDTMIENNIDIDTY